MNKRTKRARGPVGPCVECGDVVPVAEMKNNYCAGCSAELADLVASGARRSADLDTVEVEDSSSSGPTI